MGILEMARRALLVGLLAMNAIPAAVPAVQAADDRAADDHAGDDKKTATPMHFQSERKHSTGVVTIGGRPIAYDAWAGTLVVHARDWDDVPQNAPKDEDKAPRPEASMFYVAYLKNSSTHGTGGDPQRPITFLFNGGPGSSTVWLHMGAFGPRRVVTRDDSHTPAAPYPVVNNEFSLLDESDLVFIDAPGTGFSRIAGTDKEKAFFGVDQDAHAFADFIVDFLSKYGRWNSPKYIFGESYGTTRAAVLAGVLSTEKFTDVNGVILLSQILSYTNDADGPQNNPNVDQPYELVLPTYAATAWYHHRLPNQGQDLPSLLSEVESFALGDYAHALAAGSSLSDADRQAIAARLHNYTGLSTEYLLKSDLRVNAGQFEKNLLGDNDITTGRLDTRFSGPTIDPVSREADYDPQSASIGSAYVSAFNDYVRRDLQFGQDRSFKPEIDIERTWNFQHQPPGAQSPLPIAPNVMPDLAVAMKTNPDLHVMLNAGYFDLATPFFEGVFEMQHLPIPKRLAGNIEYDFYESGHMVYAHQASLQQLHAKVADFIRRTSTASLAAAGSGGKK